jgi:hypothetical protein
MQKRTGPKEREMTPMLLNCLAATLVLLLILSYWITPHPACNEEVLAPAPGQGLFVPLGAAPH